MQNYFSWLFGIRLYSGKIFNLHRAHSCCFCVECKNKAACFLGFPASVLILSWVWSISFFPCPQTLVVSYMFLYQLQRPPLLAPPRPMSNTASLSLCVSLRFSSLISVLFNSDFSLEDSRSASWAYKGYAAPVLSGVLTIGTCTHPLLGRTNPLPASADIFRLVAQLSSDHRCPFWVLFSGPWYT